MDNIGIHASRCESSVFFATSREYGMFSAALEMS